MTAAAGTLTDLIRTIETSPIVDRADAAQALAVVRDGVLTGEGPTAAGRVHFSRSLDTGDYTWCNRILTSKALDSQPVSRAEAEVLFEINDAATERMDEGRFDDLFAKAIVHHAASASGLPVPARAVALSPETAIESWAPTTAVGVNIEVLEWIAAQMRGKRRNNRKLLAVVTALIGAATTLPLAQALPGMLDFSM
ncbi:hypothetical protein JQ557_34645 [Bradyrhizobium sp. U87765 SZCCT0131]|uniref:hypothetical protein n=1 Tax=unclassified Bradyrhizobium TaxID=2631580 RepID=UPI001BAA6B43|nr:MULTISPECIES: hypothetical protein [unclassified Bradyrhizobium]MBR1223181.1 hypothetical protein [Bradyrhizobium sp. U87765 SZCCT0131]MBR1265759.1 hypothetical protein [Bradyrhizobium sp. U87765 SZCCT0134]MBR1309270.1 hypothetical protein [Bradyrhizobium sp. U87765 SZCCT0110]MBR1323151.1 hypothetical protein [Bradyrhizobium sp. U87765 SZCCT0109]MBR1350932.1 hypothetical protein [Bradyrhizobium sp. U87765 SZCCT0048]